MSLTRAAVESELVSKLRGRLANGFWTLSTLTNGSNPDLNGPIRRAVLLMGGSVAAGLTVADADLAPYAGWDVERLLDYARLETLKVCLDQSTLVDVQVDSDMQRLSQLASQLQAEIAAYEQRINRDPPSLAPMTGRDMPNDPFLPCSTRTPCRRWPYP